MVRRSAYDAVVSRSDDYIQRLIQAEGLLHEQGERIDELMAAVEKLEKHNKLLAQTIARMQHNKDAVGNTDSGAVPSGRQL